VLAYECYDSLELFTSVCGDHQASEIIRGPQSSLFVLGLELNECWIEGIHRTVSHGVAGCVGTVWLNCRAALANGVDRSHAAPPP